MLIYLKQAFAARTDGDVAAGGREGALLRVRPKAMTVAVILAGLFPILIGTGTGSEVMSRIAVRSEEHTSELQSLMRISYAVFCLKKKKCRKSNDMKQSNNRRKTCIR